MKIEIEVDDRLVPYFEAAAATLKMPLADYLAAKIVWQEHAVVERHNGARGGIIPAPNEAQVATATALGTVACPRCHAPDVVDGVKHACPDA